MGGLCEGRGFGRFEVGEGEGCEAVQVGGCCWIGGRRTRRRFDIVEVGTEEFVERVRHFWRQDYGSWCLSSRFTIMPRRRCMTSPFGE